jgi:hypothetical protein
LKVCEQKYLLKYEEREEKTKQKTALKESGTT